MTYLLGLGALFYFVPYHPGRSGERHRRDPFTNISNFLVTSSNPNWAVALAYVSVALLAIMGAIAVAYALTHGRPGRGPRADASGEPQHSAV